MHFFSEWAPFNPHARNYYSVEVNLEKRLFPSNKPNYHSTAVDYWLNNMTLFDRSLSKKVSGKKLIRVIEF